MASFPSRTAAGRCRVGVFSGAPREQLLSLEAAGVEVTGLATGPATLVPWLTRSRKAHSRPQNGGFSTLSSQAETLS